MTREEIQLLAKKTFKKNHLKFSVDIPTDEFMLEISAICFCRQIKKDVAASLIVALLSKIDESKRKEGFAYQKNYSASHEEKLLKASVTIFNFIEKVYIYLQQQQDN